MVRIKAAAGGGQVQPSRNMRRILDPYKLGGLAERLCGSYQNVSPYPHAVIDNFIDEQVLEEAMGQFPSPTDLAWYKYDNPLEKKLAYNHIDRFPEVLWQILVELNSSCFVAFLEKLTGIQGLIPDPDYIGGGLHQSERGGKLDIHVDFNYHPKTKLDRRLNILIYLNKNWREEYLGHFELWDKNMGQAVQRILPVFNRLVVFNTTDDSNHGFPDPIECPAGWTRKSIATYYYTNGRPESERSAPHSTIYKKRPQDPVSPEMDALRQLRSKGRLQDLTVVVSKELSLAPLKPPS